MKLFIALLLICPISLSIAQVQVSNTRNYGGPGQDILFRLYQNTNGYFWCGASDSIGGNIPLAFGGMDAWIGIVDQNGDSVHMGIMGGNGNDYLKDVLQLSDTSFACLIESSSANGSFTGNFGGSDLWIKGYYTGSGLSSGLNFGGSNDETAWRMTPKLTGGYIVAGSSNSNDGNLSGNYGDQDVWILALASNLSVVWSKHFGGSDYDEAIAAFQLSDGNIMVFANTYSSDNEVHNQHGHSDVWVIKLSSLGDTLWTKTLGGGAVDWAYEAKMLNDSTFALAGMSNSSDGDFMYRDKVSPMYGFYYVMDDNGQYLCSGLQNSPGNDDVFLTDVIVDSLYYATGFGMTQSDTLNLNKAPNGGMDLILVDFNGFTSRDSWFLGGNGDDGVMLENINCKAVKNNDDSFVIGASGFSNNLSAEYHGESDVMLMFASINTGISNVVADKITLFPNPAGNVIQIRGESLSDTYRWHISDAGGRILMTGQNENHQPIDLSGLVAGFYLITIEDGQQISNMPFLLQK